MWFNAMLNTISVLSWWLVLFVEETGLPGENYRRFACNISKKYQSGLYFKSRYIV